jgi:hypothetical protein
LAHAAPGTFRRHPPGRFACSSAPVSADDPTSADNTAEKQRGQRKRFEALIQRPRHWGAKAVEMALKNLHFLPLTKADA